MLVWLVTGCSWVTGGRLLGGQVSDTTLLPRRDEWEAAQVFERIAAEAVAAYGRIVGLDLAEVYIDRSTRSAPCDGAGTDKGPVDRHKLGWKWAIATDGAEVPVAWAAEGANRSSVMLFELTIPDIARRGLHHDTETLHPDHKQRDQVSWTSYRVAVGSARSCARGVGSRQVSDLATSGIVGPHGTPDSIPCRAQVRYLCTLGGI